MKPRERRLLQALLEKEKVSVKDLRSIVGALNPAQVVLTLRRKGWDIRTQFISVHDRDGLICHPGCYWLDDREKERVKHFLKEADGAEAPAPSANGNAEHSNTQLSDSQDSREEEK